MSKSIISTPSPPSPLESVSFWNLKTWLGSGWTLLLNVLASIQVVWFYISWVHPYLILSKYEDGVERMPYQGRMLMMWPLRWAHSSAALNWLAAKLNPHEMYFEFGVRPEGILQAAVYLACILIAGFVATALYKSASKTQALISFIYPLTLLMVAVTYCFNTVHHLRMVYDLPALALFGVGIYVIYFRKNFIWCAFVFVAATVNRETSILLVPLLVLRDYQVMRGRLRPGAVARALLPVLILAAFWLGWHHWVTQLFKHSMSERGVRLKLNIRIIGTPLTWPQLASVGGYSVPLIIAHRRAILDPVLRRWLWVLPVWAVFMLTYAIVIETRTFGELIPYLACCAALVAENTLLDTSRGPGRGAAG